MSKMNFGRGVVNGNGTSSGTKRRWRLTSAVATAMASVAGLAGHVHDATAASASWTALTAGNWSTGTNWNTSAAPGQITGGYTSTDTATFNAATGVTVTIDQANQNIDNITFSGSITTSGYSIGTAAGTNPLYLTAGGTLLDSATSSGTQTINAPLALQGAYTINDTAASNTLLIIGAITGTGPLTITGSGASAANSSVQFNGSSLASYTGTINVTTGTNDKVTYVNGTTPTSATFNIGTTNTSTATLYTNLTFGAGDTFNLYGAGNSETLGALRLDGGGSIAGSVVLQSAGVTIGSNTGTSTISGNISGISGAVLTKVGGGTIVLSGTDSYTGGTTITTGALQFNTSSAVPSTGQITSSALGYVQFASGAAPVAGHVTLTGTGSISLVGALTTAYDALNSGWISTGSTGFLANTGATYQTTENVNFAASSYPSLGIAFNNSIAATYSGTLTPSTGGYKLAAYGAGGLTITSPFTGANTATLSTTGATVNLPANSTNTGLTSLLGTAGTFNITGYEVLPGGLFLGNLNTVTTSSVTTNINSGAVVSIGSGGISIAETNAYLSALNLNVGTSGTAIVTNTGPLSILREGQVTIGSAGVFNQSGTVTVGPSGYSTGASDTLTVNGIFNYTGTTPIGIVPTAGAGSSTLTVGAGGIFSTDQGFNYGANSSTGVANLVLSGGGILQLTANIAALTSGATSGTFQVGNASGGIINTGGFTTAISTPISNVSGQLGQLTVTGTGGTVTLSAVNTYTGPTVVASGATLALSSTGSINAASVLNLSGGTLSLASGGAAQTFASTTVGVGSSSILNVSGNILTLGAITRGTASGTIGGTLDFTAGSSTTTSANLNPPGGQQTILGGYATVGGTTWAVAGNTAGTATVVTGLSSYSSTFAAGLDIDASGSPTPGAMTINSLRFNTPGAATVASTGNISIATGGILETAAVGANAVTISGSPINAADSNNGSDLVVIQNNNAVGGGMTINSLITNAANPATQTGVLTSGSATITGLTSTAGLSVGMPISGTNISSGATIIAINSATSITISSTATGTVSPTLTFTSNNGFTKSGPGTVTLTANNTYTGPTYVNAGTLIVNNRTSANPNIYTVAQAGTLYLGTGIGSSYGTGVTVNGSGTAATTGLYLNGGQKFNFQSSLTLQTEPTTVRSYGTGEAYLQGYDTNGNMLTVAAAASGSVFTSTVGLYPASYGYTMNILPGAATATGDLTINGTIDGNATLTGALAGGIIVDVRKSGAGSLLLTGASTSAHGIGILAGSVILGGGNNRLPIGTGVVLGNGGTTSGQLLLNGISQQLANIYAYGTGTNDSVLGNSAAASSLLIAYNTTTPALFSGNLGGPGLNQNNLSFTMKGTGVFELSGTNTYTGATSVTSGTLDLLTPTALPGYTTSTSASSVNVGSGATLAIGISGAGAFQASDLSAIQSTATFAGTRSIGIDTTNGSTAFTPPITGTLNFTKLGTGTLSLTGSNNYVGTTTVSTGTLEAEKTVSLPGYTSGGNISVASGATLALAVGGTGQFASGDVDSVIGNTTLPAGSTVALDTSAGSFTYATSMSGLYGFTKLGTNTLNLGGFNAYSGPTTIAGGTLSLGTIGSINSASVLVLAGGTLATAGGSQSFASTTLSAGSAGITNTGTGTVGLGTITRSVGGNIDFGASVVSVSNSNTNGILGGYATVNGGANWAAVTGGTIGALSASDPSYNTSSALGAASTFAALNVDVNSTQTQTVVVTPNSLRFNAAAANTLTLATGTNVIASGGILVTPSVGANVSTISGGNIEASSGSDLVLNQYNTLGGLTINSVIINNGTSSLTKAGPGTATLTADNTFAGSTYVNGGTLVITGAGGSGGALGGPQVIVNPGATLLLNSTSADVLGYTPGRNALVINDGTVTNNGQRWTVENPITMTGGTLSGTASSAYELAGGSSIVATSDSAGNPATITAQIPLAQNETFIVNRGVAAPAYDLVVNVPISTYSGITGLTKAGSGVMELSAANTYTGGTNITGGTLAFGVANALTSANGAFNVSGGTFDVNGLSPSLGMVNLVSGVITNSNSSAGALTASVFGLESGSASANLVSGGEVVKTTAGVAYLSGTNTFSSTTLVNNGVLEAVKTASLPGYLISGNITAQSGGTVAAAVGTAPQFTPANVTTALGNINFLSGSYFGFDTTYSGGSFMYAPAIAGIEGIAKLGAGTLYIPGANTYSGGTVIDQGTLSVAGDSALGTAPASPAANITINGGTLQVTSPTTINTNRSIVLNSAGVFTGGGTVDVNGNAVSYAGVISGGGTLNVTSTGASAGSGVLTLSGTSSTYTGGTVLTSGTLNIAGDGSLGAVPTGATTNITFNGGTLQFASPTTTLATNRTVLVNTGGGTIDLNSNAVTYGGLLSGTGNVVVNNTGNGSSGVLTLTNSANTDSGTLTINAGTVNLANATYPGPSTEQFSTITVNTGATLKTSGVHSFGYLGGFRPLLVVNGGTITNTGNDNYLGQITMTGGTISGTGQYRLQTTTLSPTNATITTNATATTATVSVASLSLVSQTLFTIARGTVAGPDLLVSSSLTNSSSLSVNGPGELELNSNTSNNSGGVFVNSGSLLVANTAGSATGTGAVNIYPASTLFGTGLISGAVNVYGTVFTGLTSDVAGKTASTLTLGTGSTLAGTLLEDLTAAPSSSDELVFSGSSGVNLGGTLTVNNPNSIAFAAGQSYDILGYGSNPVSGTFSTVTLPTLSGSLQWNQSNLYSTGVISIVSTGPANLTWNDAGGSPADGFTWDIATNQNFNNGSGASVYHEGDIVTFNDTNNYPTNPNAYSVTLNTTVHPKSVTVTTTNAYSITGTGGIADATAGPTPLTLTGTGSLTLGGSNTYTGGTTVGTGTDTPKLILSGAHAFPIGTPLTVNTGASVQIAAHTGASSNVVVVQTSTLTNSGKIDITNNSLVIASGSTVAGISSQLASGAIMSSFAASDTTYLTTIGVATGLPTFDGLTGTSTDVLVKYTYYGDANLDGAVDGSDYTLIDAGFNSAGTLTGWQNGDFNNDGVIDGSDYTLIDNAFNTQGASLGTNPLALVAGATAQIAGGTSAVPEPTTLGLVGIGAVGLIGRRRRRN